MANLNYWSYGGIRILIFLVAGAEAYGQDNENAKIKMYDTGHFALEAHAEEIGEEIITFMQGLQE